LTRTGAAETEGVVPATAAEQRSLVRRGYDTVSHAYRNDDGRSGLDGLDHPGQYRAWVDELAGVLPRPARVLDLGCGCGVPATRALLDQGLDVVGVDFSPVQVARARRLVPGATFIEADMAVWEPDAAAFDAVTSFYALIHVPLEDQQRLIARLATWLRPGGWAMLIVGSGRWRAVEDFFGAPMFWDHADRDTYLQWLRDAGFEVVWYRFVPERDGGHVLVLASTSERAENPSSATRPRRQ
jgi:SAM-dependent methyltransferase